MKKSQKLFRELTTNYQKNTKKKKAFIQIPTFRGK